MRKNTQAQFEIQSLIKSESFKSKVSFDSSKDLNSFTKIDASYLLLTKKKPIHFLRME